MGIRKVLLALLDSKFWLQEQKKATIAAVLKEGAEIVVNRRVFTSTSQAHAGLPWELTSDCAAID
eukprot:1156686-Pelagomonas_calceolata.AAC.6